MGRHFGTSKKTPSVCFGSRAQRMLAIRALNRRFDRVCIEELPWEKCLETYDSDVAFFFCDPPYLDAGGAAYAGWSKHELARFCERILDHFDLTRFFDTVHGAELDGRLGEKAELISHVLATEAIDPAACVMIGDRRYDIEGARANGIKVAAVGWGYGTIAEFETFLAAFDVVVSWRGNRSQVRALSSHDCPCPHVPHASSR